MQHIEKAFEKIGARAKIRRDQAVEPAGPWASLNILRDRGGREFFDILLSATAQPEVNLSLIPGGR